MDGKRKPTTLFNVGVTRVRREDPACNDNGAVSLHDREDEAIIGHY